MEMDCKVKNLGQLFQVVAFSKKNYLKQVIVHSLFGNSLDILLLVL